MTTINLTVHAKLNNHDTPLWLIYGEQFAHDNAKQLVDSERVVVVAFIGNDYFIFTDYEKDFESKMIGDYLYHDKWYYGRVKIPEYSTIFIIPTNNRHLILADVRDLKTYLESLVDCVDFYKQFEDDFDSLSSYLGKSP